MKKEYNLDKMKLKKKGPLITKETKIVKTIRLAPDILNWLMVEAAERGIGYQTLIHMLLTDAMKQTLSKNDIRSEIRKMIKEELKKAS